MAKEPKKRPRRTGSNQLPREAMPGGSMDSENSDFGGVLAGSSRSMSGANLEHPAVQAAIDEAFRQYWKSLPGSLRRLNIRRSVITDLRVETPDGSALVSEGDGDPAPLPSPLMSCAARAIQELADLETMPAPHSLSWGVADRLFDIAAIFPARRESERAERERTDLRGVAYAHMKVASDGLSSALRYYPGSPEHGRLSACYGLAVAAELTLGSDTQRRVAIDGEIAALLDQVAARDDFPRALRSLARRLSAGRIDRDAALNLLDPIDDESATRGTDDSTSQGVPPAPVSSTALPGAATHSVDFASVNWFGTPYTFTNLQGACIAVLWTAWAQGTPVLSQETIREKAKSSADPFRLAHVFRDAKSGHPHAAWGAMIVPAGKGRFRLAPKNH